MSAPAFCMRPNRSPATIDAVTAKARQCAYLFEFGWLDLPEAVDRFQFWAERSGAIASLGQDLVQTVAHEAFAPIKREEM